MKRRPLVPIYEDYRTVRYHIKYAAVECTITTTREFTPCSRLTHMSTRWLTSTQKVFARA